MSVVVLSLAGSDGLYDCPSSVYDCRSLELSLRSSADEFITPEFMASYHDDTYVNEICRLMHIFRNDENSRPKVIWFVILVGHSFHFYRNYENSRSKFISFVILTGYSRVFIS
ncbi:hypothetical protein ElyMa_001778700 [Elysia marginata]|uniref:Caspase family p20 domain-containing protein n=1 Tax=Elysia marginata TaxID=1093978 RepID=A0AAV4EDS7_9GAST|nr:hypothetical protein ElyMa_001778700 [Elysia marginata]